MSATDPGLNCPSCGIRHRLGALFDAATGCWPWRRWVGFACPGCGEAGILVVGFSRLSVGRRGRPGTPDVELAGAVHLDEGELVARWASNGVRLSLGQGRWTVKAVED